MAAELKWYDDKAKKLKVNKSGDVVYLTSPLYEGIDFVNHGMSTRIGGVSDGVCASMNFAYNDYDTVENVAKNHRIFCEAVGIDINRIVKNKQVHSTKVIKIDENQSFRDSTTPGFDFEGADGFITNVPNVTLFTFTADCSPVMIVDPVNKAVGLCHSGWRGTVGRIAQNAINMMSESYGSTPEDLLVTVGPSICPECFEVEWDMISEARKGFSEDKYEKIYYQKNDVKYQFNLWNANKEVLLEANVKEENIFLPNLCTKCNPDTLFSHRNMGLKRGTLITFLGIK